MTRTAADQTAEPDPDRSDSRQPGAGPPGSGRPAATTGKRRGKTEGDRQRRNLLAEQWERRLAVPVILAAAVAVPAVFLTIFGEGRTAFLGNLLNWASLVVLTAEAAVLFLLTGDRLAWVRRHKVTLIILVIAVPAVIFALAPVQALRLVLRLVQFFGALRVLRAGRIIKAGRVLARRSGWTGPWRYAPILLGSIVAAVFVGIILADPTSTTRRLLDEHVSDWLTATLAVLAGAILAAATFVVLRNRNR